MKHKAFLCVVLVCTVMMSCLTAPADAAEIYSDTIWQEDMEYELINPSAIPYLNESAVLLSTGALNASIPAHSLRYVSQPVSLEAGDTVTFNCSYSPSSASMDFGVIAPNGRFYSINVKEGSINQSLGISESGSYSVAVRNNSSQTVRVVGFVEY